MSGINKKVVKKIAIGATLLATSPVWAKDDGGGLTTGGKSQLGVNHLSLEETPGQNAIVCASDENSNSKTGTNIVPNDITIAVDPFANAFIELQFTVRDVLAQDKDHVLILVYSPKTSPSPEIPTPRSINKLGLNLSALEILAIYQIPSQTMLPQGSTRLGAASPQPHSAVTFSVNLDTGVLPTYIRNNEKVYFQAALLSQENFDAGNFPEMILSEMDTLAFEQISCPDGYGSAGVDNDGTLMITDDSGEVGKTTETVSTEASSTTKN